MSKFCAKIVDSKNADSMFVLMEFGLMLLGGGGGAINISLSPQCRSYVIIGL